MKTKKIIGISLIVVLSVVSAVAGYKYYQVKNISLEKDSQINSLQNQVNDLQKENVQLLQEQEDGKDSKSDNSQDDQASSGCDSGSEICIDEWSAKLNIPNADKVTYEFQDSAGETVDGRSYASSATLIFKPGAVVAGCEDSIGVDIIKLQDGSYAQTGSPALCPEDDENGSTNIMLQQIIDELNGKTTAPVQPY